MIINTNYEIFRSAVGPARQQGIMINIIQTESPYRLAQEYSPNIVLCDKVPNDGAFPIVKFVGPNFSFPNYKYNFRFGFDHELLDNADDIDVNVHGIFVNRMGLKNKAFIKKIESLDIPIKVLGMGFGISQLNLTNLNERKIASLYKKSTFCAADNVEDILRIHYLNKICLTPFSYENCINVFSDEINFNISHNTQEMAFKNSWKNIFNEIFELTQEDIRWK